MWLEAFGYWNTDDRRDTALVVTTHERRTEQSART